MTKVASDHNARAIKPLLESLFRDVLHDEEPLFVSDEATMLDVSMSEPAELAKRCSTYYRTAVTLDDLRTPLWRLLPRLELARLRR